MRTARATVARKKALACAVPLVSLVILAETEALRQSVDALKPSTPPAMQALAQVIDAGLGEFRLAATPTLPWGVPSAECLEEPAQRWSDWVSHFVLHREDR